MQITPILSFHHRRN